MILLFGLIFISCEENINFDNPNFQPKIIVNSIFTNDSIWVIKLTHTTSVFDPIDTNNFVDDAAILISNIAGEGLCDMYYVGNGVYKSHHCTSGVEQEYKIFISSKKFGTVSSKSKIPHKSNVNNIKIIKTENKVSEVEFKIDESGKKSNYYIWSVVKVDTTAGKVKSLENIRNIDFRSWVNEIKKTAHIGGVSQIKFSLSSTEQELSAANNTATVFTSLDLVALTDENANPQNKSIPMIRLMTVSEDLFNYYNSLEEHLKYNNTQSSVIEPHKIFTNIEGGFGIFAGYSLQYIPIDR